MEIDPKLIPDEVVEAARDALFSDKGMRGALAAGLAKWPGAFPHTFRGPLEGFGYVLPFRHRRPEMTDDTVVQFPGQTVLDIDADAALNGAIGRLDAVVIAGIDKDGEMYFASSLGSNAETVWLMEKFKHFLLEATYDR